ncbi:hypothetical protein EON67_09935 [archaeon]|nr:MAG: hypothetical protein EON67_09935 [archaeon]
MADLAREGSTTAASVANGMLLRAVVCAQRVLRPCGYRLASSHVQSVRAQPRTPPTLRSARSAALAACVCAHARKPEALRAGHPPVQMRTS